MKKQLISMLLSCSITAILFVPVSAEEVKLSVGDKIEGFTVTETGECKIFDADTVLLTHDKTGGQFLYIANDDTNRAFDIAFHTPADDTGVSHVFEHASLNGSEKYPANIFFNVASKTINTFMNAYTTMRSTYYPVSSLSDEQLLRLADYYLDGVFNPLIITDESIFEQEAWRYELSSPEDELTLNGTVYSEVKGSITPFGRAYYNTMKALYPGSNWAAISGGDPDVIPELTYDDVVEYHSAYYKPSNSLVILYGKADYEKYLVLVDEYFSEYDDTKPVIADPDYVPVSGNIEKAFRISGNENTGNTVIYAVPCAINNETDIYDMALCADFLQSESSLLSQYMKQVMPAVSLNVSFDFSLTEPTIAFIASNVQSGEETQLKEIIEASVEELAKEGFSEGFMDAYLTSIERSLLLLPDGTGNKGISIIDGVNNLWSINGNANAYFEYLDYICSLEGDALNSTFKKLIRTYLIEPEVSVYSVSIPDPGLSAENEAALKEKLAEIKAGMSADEINEIVARTNSTKTDSGAVQDELINKINVSSVDILRNDLDSYKTKEYPYSDETTDGVRYLTARADVGDIGYARIYFDVSELTNEQLLYLELFNDICNLFGSTNYSASELYDKAARYVSGSTKFLPTDDDTLYMTYDLTMLNDDISETYNVLYEILYETQFDDTDYLKAVIAGLIDSWESSVLDSDILVSRAQAQNNKKAAYYSYMEGLDYYKFLKIVSGTLETNPDTVIDQLQEIQKALKNRYNASIVFAGNDSGIELNNKYSKAFFDRLSDEEHGKAEHNIPLPEGNEAIITNTDVNYNMELAPLDMLDVGRDGALYVTQNLVYDKFLMPYLRNEKGAYGVRYTVNEYGMYICSYRDPQIASTFDYYNKIGDLLDNTELTQEELDGYIMSTFSERAQNQRGLLSDVSHMLTTKVYTSEKDGYEILKEILDTTPEQVQLYAESYRKLAETGITGTVGRESDILSNAYLYDNIIYPFADDRIKIFYNGTEIETDTAPVIENDRALVPLRAVFEAMDCTVDWSQEEQKITVAKDDISVVLYIGSEEMNINGNVIILDAVPNIINERTMVPVRAISEAVNCEVEWDDTERNVIITMLADERR